MNPLDLKGRPRFMWAAFFMVTCVLVFFAWRTQPDARPEVFVYYANETSPEGDEAKSWDTIIGWLASSDNPKVSKIAGQLRRDREQFPSVVDEDLGRFREYLASADNLAGAVVFSNRLARQGKYLLFRPDVGRLEEVALAFPSSDNLIYQGSPLANPESLDLCLDEVVRQFDPRSHDFVLHSKSHGNAKMAMTPRLVVRAEQTNREELLAVASGELADENLPRWTSRLGITKDQYFATLKQLGDEERMQFALVFMEACKGTLPDDLEVWPPRNIRRLYMSGPEGAEYRNLDYAAILPACSPSQPLSQVLDTALAGKFYILVRGIAPSWMSWKPVRLLLWWLPLVLFVAWLAWRRLRKRTPGDYASERMLDT